MQDFMEGINSIGNIGSFLINYSNFLYTLRLTLSRYRKIYPCWKKFIRNSALDFHFCEDAHFLPADIINNIGRCIFV